MPNPTTCKCGRSFVPRYKGQQWCDLGCDDLLTALRESLAQASRKRDEDAMAMRVRASDEAHERTMERLNEEVGL